MKKILILGFISLIVFIIYLTTIDKKIYFVALGDSIALGYQNNEQISKSYNDYVRDYLENNNILEKYVADFINKDYRTTDLIRDIEENKKIYINKKQVAIKNVLIKADLITLSIGVNDLIYKLGLKTAQNDNLSTNEIYEYIDDIIEDMDELFNVLREYCKENIVMIGYYNPLSQREFSGIDLEAIFNYTNTKIRELCNKYDIDFVDIYSLFKENVDFLNMEEGLYPLNNGYQAIGNEINALINNKILK